MKTNYGGYDIEWWRRQNEWVLSGCGWQLSQSRFTSQQPNQ